MKFSKVADNAKGEITAKWAGERIGVPSEFSTIIITLNPWKAVDSYVACCNEYLELISRIYNGLLTTPDWFEQWNLVKVAADSILLVRSG